jgi:hypothetical protein
MSCLMKQAGKKGQLKIQQMAFVLVAMIIFFALVALFYFSIRYSGLQEDVESLREQEVIETVRKMSATGEFAYSSAGDCAACVDLDKILVLKEKESYQGFWKSIALLQVVRVYPVFGENGEVECTRENYPDCDVITVVEENKNFRSHSAFVALCRYDELGSHDRCELGKIIMAFESVE